MRRGVVIEAAGVVVVVGAVASAAVAPLPIPVAGVLAGLYLIWRASTSEVL